VNGRWEDETDEELMRWVADGNVRAFDQLFCRRRHAVYCFAYRMLQDHDLAEDVTQECFLRVWRARRRYRPTSAVRTWLFTITRRLCLDQIRRQSREVEISLDASEGDAPIGYESVGFPANPEQIVLSREMFQVVNEAMDQLPPLLREVVLLRETEEMSYEQIAAVIERPVGTVRSRLSAARKRLRLAALQWMGCDDQS